MIVSCSYCLLLLILCFYSCAPTGVDLRAVDSSHFTNKLPVPFLTTNAGKLPATTSIETFSAPMTILPCISNPEHANDAIQRLMACYPNRIRCVQCQQFSNCEIYLCGTLHVSEASIEMVKNTIATLRPQYVVLELCEERLGTLEEPDPNARTITLRSMFTTVVAEKKWSSMGRELLAWLQQKAAGVLGSKVGGEQYIACKEGHRIGSTIILGDRSYTVTIQRTMDRLSAWQKVRVCVCMVWDALTCTVAKVTEYVRQSEAEDAFVAQEMEELAKHFPPLAEVMIHERDEYIAQTICQVAQKGFRGPATTAFAGGHQQPSKGRIVAVLGAAHLAGVQRRLLEGGVSSARMREISRSSQQACTWPGEEVLHVVDTVGLYSGAPPAAC